jgi:hypothetical protein
MSSEADLVSLLRRCHLEPESSLPRQVVADWLEENGTSEAEAAMAGLLRKAVRDCFAFLEPGFVVPPEFREVATMHYPTWLPGISVDTHWGIEGGLFSLEYRADQVVAGKVAVPSLPGGMAWVSRIKVVDVASKRFRALLASPCLDGFHGTLSLYCAGGVSDMADLFAAQPWLRTLTGLAFHFKELQAEFRKLCRIGPWEEVVSLSISRCGLQTRDFAALADSPLGQHLRLLDISENKFDGSGLEAVCRASPGLFALYSKQNRIDSAGVKAVSQLRSLRWLNLFRSPGLTLAGVEALASGPCAEGLYSLSLSSTNLGDEACRLLANGRLRNLAHLYVSEDQHITADGVRVLVEAANLPSLVWLGLPSRLKRQGRLPSRTGLKIL